MVSSSKIESLAQRFAPYIDELHDFFSSRKVPFGTLTDLQAFPARLREPAFHEEMVSMVRSIVYRESEALPRTELMDLLAIAVGGPQIEEASPELHQPLRQILDFVTEVVRSQRITLPPELPVNEEEELEAPAKDAAGVHAPLNLVFETTPEPYRAPELHPASIPQVPAPMESLPINDRLSRALMDSEAGVGTDSARQPSSAAIPVRPVAAPPTPVFTPERPKTAAELRRPSSSLSSFLRNAYWIPGVCALLLVLAAAYFLSSRFHPQPSAAVPEPSTAIPNVQSPKPSAYGPTLGGSQPRAQRVPSRGEPGDSALNQPLSESPAGNRPASRASITSPLGTSARRSELRPALSASKITPRVLGGREGVFLASSGMMAAHLLTAPAPSYPKLASLTHVEGEVIVQVVVARDGRVEATRVLEGPRLLRSAAEHAIRRWRYRPYLVDGKPTDVATIVTVNFRLSR